ncbi:MAG: hypothetical protein JNK69_04125 [Saprospiraceae bacterium]|nr:hypothetical protein [Candidatus Vicinibacter proximus]MBL7822574.1 hypothetical protein [Saprospiraceae bacterium]MCC6843482.1 hypothetical protein [Saprospiraceae bacterium]HRG34387.1 hypothetical protein [Saprospiraceae bacterium]
MSKSRIVLSFGVVAFIACCLPGCYKVTTFIENNGTEVTEVVSLTKDIQPVFNNSCSISGCHNSGGIKPNLSEGNSYNSLSNGGYVNTGSPEASGIYLWLAGKRATPMPPSGPANPSNINQLVLAWIKQGANNN